MDAEQHQRGVSPRVPAIGRMSAMAHPRAGQPAQPEDLIDVDAVLSAYYDLTPDPSNPEQQVVFGTSGHRGSSLDTAFNDLHIAATTQAIVEYRASQGVTGPLYLGKDTHALSKPAWTTAIEVLLANDVTVCCEGDDDYTPTPAVSRAIVVHNANRGRERHRRRDRGHPLAQPPAGRRLQVQPAARRAGRLRRHRRHRRPGQRLDGRPRSHPPQVVRRRERGAEPLRLPGRVLRGPGERAQPACGPRRRSAHRRRPDGRGQCAVLGLHLRAPGHRPDRGQPQGRPAVGVHDLGHRRQDPDGLLLTERDGQPDRQQGRLRHRHRQRRRRRPARHRHPRLRVDEPQRLPGGRDPATSTPTGPAGGATPGSARPWSPLP